MVHIIRITREEADVIRERFPDVHMRVTSKHAPARKHTYYVEEAKRVMSYLRKARSGAKHG